MKKRKRTCSAAPTLSYRPVPLARLTPSSDGGVVFELIAEGRQAGQRRLPAKGAADGGGQASGSGRAGGKWASIGGRASDDDRASDGGGRVGGDDRASG
jgi:hypothetical protein